MRHTSRHNNALHIAWVQCPLGASLSVDDSVCLLSITCDTGCLALISSSGRGPSLSYSLHKALRTVRMTKDDADAAAAQTLRGKCRRFMARKHKYCTASIAAAHGGDGAYCSIHRSDAPKRVPCPLDPRHDVKELDLTRHMTICPSLKVATSPWMRSGVNDVPTPPASPPSFVKLRDVSREEGIAFLLWLREQHGCVVTQAWWRPRDLGGGSAHQLASLAAYVGGGNEKHRLQQSILCNLLLRDAAAGRAALRNVVEVGAGKGGVACALKMARPLLPIVLVERAVFRDHKERELNKRLRWALAPASDVQHPTATATASRIAIGLQSTPPPTAASDAQLEWSPIERILLDAKDFDGAAWWQQQRRSDDNRGAALCGVLGKHLCGACTDYTLRIAVNIGRGGGQSCTPPIGARGTPAEEGDSSSPAAQHNNPKRAREDAAALASSQRGRDGSCVVLATCCHHLCAYHSYVGKEATLVVPGSDPALDPSEHRLLFPDQRAFDLVRSICGWALIGPQPEVAATDEAETHDDGNVGPTDDTKHGGDAPWTSAISLEEKLMLGRMAKTLIDAGRVWFLHRSRLFASIEYTSYVDATVSGEHYAIVASCS